MYELWAMIPYILSLLLYFNYINILTTSSWRLPKWSSPRSWRPKTKPQSKCILFNYLRRAGQSVNTAKLRRVEKFKPKIVDPSLIRITITKKTIPWISRLCTCPSGLKNHSKKFPLSKTTRSSSGLKPRAQYKIVKAKASVKK